jgi:hypothetical protein
MRFPWKYIWVSGVIGLLLGGSAGIFYARDLARHWMQKSPEIFLKRLDHELHLSDPQRTQIHTLLIAKRDKMAAFENELRKSTRADIRVILTPDQQPPFDAMIARHDAERRKREAQ